MACLASTGTAEHRLHLGDLRHPPPGPVGQVGLHRDRGPADVQRPADGAHLTLAHSPPSVSASPIRAPPCMIPAVVHRSGAQARRPLTSPAATASSITPSAAANGIWATAAA